MIILFDDPSRRTLVTSTTTEFHRTLTRFRQKPTATATKLQATANPAGSRAARVGFFQPGRYSHGRHELWAELQGFGYDCLYVYIIYIYICIHAYIHIYI